jgi:hypothetical protein
MAATNDDPMLLPEQGRDRMPTDESGAAQDQDVHAFLPHFRHFCLDRNI